MQHPSGFLNDALPIDWPGVMIEQGRQSYRDAQLVDQPCVAPAWRVLLRSVRCEGVPGG
ncbi:hypothetical protein [Tautonia rosea]|uniref:hypothetical protein n=1 Tax=Tautonia rosea TaxID=2728037 RepID=UPI001474CF64|nr:hypothetical protein [Tautonia rosea]